MALDTVVTATPSSNAILLSVARAILSRSTELLAQQS